MASAGDPVGRRYDKGERRHKHVGRGAEPTIAFDEGDPKRWIGKCPAALSQADRQRLLDEAVAIPNGDRELSVAKKLYAVHEGAIYEAQTSDRGRSYHGYPYKGKLAGAVLDRLSQIADNKGCTAASDQWVERHIERHGSRR